MLGPVTDWQPLQGEPSLSHYDSWDRLQLHRDPEVDKWKKMDGYKAMTLNPGVSGSLGLSIFVRPKILSE